MALAVRPHPSAIAAGAIAKEPMPDMGNIGGILKKVVNTLLPPPHA